jgi:hypothetical protein
MAEPSPDPQRPVRRVDVDHGVTVLTNSTREPSELRQRPAPAPPVTRSLKAPAAVTLAMPDEPQRPSEPSGSNGWLALPIVLVSIALGLVSWRTRRTLRPPAPEPEVRDQTRISVPPRAPLSFRARKSGTTPDPQWVSQPPSSKRKRTGT